MAEIEQATHANVLAATGQDRREAFSLLSQAARPDHNQLRLATAGLLVAAVLEALGPLFGKTLIDHFLLPRNAQIPQMAALLAGALVCGCVATWLRYFQLLRLAGLAMRSVQRIRQQVYGHVMNLPMAFFDSAITGKLVSRVTNDTEAVKALYIQVLFVMLDAIITVGGIFALMVWLNPRLALLAAALVPAVVLVVWLYQHFSGAAVARARELRSDINAQMAESINGMNVLQATNATVQFGQRFGVTNAAHYQARQAEVRANAWLLRPMLDALNVVVLAAVIWVFGTQEIGGGNASGSVTGPFSEIGGLFGVIEIGVLYAFISYVERVIDPLINITIQFSEFQQSVVAASRVNVLLKEAEAPQPKETMPITQGAIAVHGLDFAYGNGPQVLHHLKLQIPAGGFYGVVGHTGSGKSTLLSLLLRFYGAAPGALTIDGRSIDSYGERDFRSAVGLVPQEPFLLSASAFENINMGRGLSLAQVEVAAKAAQADGFIAALEKGYDTPLGEGGARLSVGQKQLIAIARALAAQPKILLLDEATSHIDSETEAAVQTALAALRGRITVVAIAHRLSTIKDADQIVVLDHGKIAEQGRHTELLATPGGIYQRLYELQQIEVTQESEPLN